jgi:hypothetical protein
MCELGYEVNRRPSSDIGFNGCNKTEVKLNTSVLGELYTSSGFIDFIESGILGHIRLHETRLDVSHENQ